MSLTVSRGCEISGTDWRACYAVAEDMSDVTSAGG